MPFQENSGLGDESDRTKPLGAIYSPGSSLEELYRPLQTDIGTCEHHGGFSMLNLKPPTIPLLRILVVGSSCSLHRSEGEIDSGTRRSAHRYLQCALKLFPNHLLTEEAPRPKIRESLVQVGNLTVERMT